MYEVDFINIDGNWIHKTAIIYPCVKLGKNNVIGAYCVIGANGEIRNCKDFKGEIFIGDNNVISELVTIQRPKDEHCYTIIGDNNLIMAHSHIGHDAKIGDNTEICTGTIVGGYAQVGNGSKVKLGVTIRNRICIGENSIIGMGSVVTKNVPNNSVAYGNPAKPRE